MIRKFRYGVILLSMMMLCLVPAAAFAETETVPESAETQTVSRGDVVHFTGDVIIKPGEVVRGNVVAMSGNIDIGGKVYGNVTAMAGTVKLRSGSLVTGNVTAMAGGIDWDEGARIGGRIVSREDIRDFGGSNRYTPHANYNYDYRYDFHPSPWDRFSGWLLSLLGLLALTAAAVALFPKQIGSMKNSLEEDPVRQLGIGLLGWIVLPVVLLALILTVIGIPVAILVVLCLPILILIGFVIMALFAGQRLDQALADRWPRFADERPLIQSLKGIALIWIIAAIPLVGWLVWPLAAIFGLGTVLSTRFGTNRPWFNRKNPDNRPPASGDSESLPEPAGDGQTEEPETPDAPKEPDVPAGDTQGKENADHEKEE